MLRKIWDHEEFAKINLPEVIGNFSSSEFSEMWKYDGIRFLDCPVKFPDTDVRIPDKLEKYFPLIVNVMHSESRFKNTNLRDYYIYITVDQKWVERDKTGRRPGAHSDAYLSKNEIQLDVTRENADVIKQETGFVDHTYVVADVFPTEFFKCGFPLDSTNHDTSMKTFDMIADENKDKIVTYADKQLLRMDPYVIHRSAVANRSTYRTFIKISVSKKKYARQGNTHNDLFDYDWNLTPRNNNRNSPW